MNDSKNDECALFRLDFEKRRGEEPGPDTGISEQGKKHADSCVACHKWAFEMESLLDMSAALPQFDVPEALTQQILAAVETERKMPRMSQYPLVLPLSIIGAAALLTVLPFDSLEGMLSWGIGLAAMVLLKGLLSGVQAGQQAV